MLGLCTVLWIRHSIDNFCHLQPNFLPAAQSCDNAIPYMTLHKTICLCSSQTLTDRDNVTLIRFKRFQSINNTVCSALHFVSNWDGFR
jgi:hypothetical protein